MIELDIRSLMPAELLYGTSPAILAVLVDDIAAAARSKWVGLSQERLKTSQQSYTAGISGVKHEHGVAWIELNGVFPNMIEGGFDEFDLRDSLLQPGKRGVKMSKDGDLYRSVMFRLGTGSAKGANFQKMGDLYGAQLGKRHGQMLGKKAHKLLSAMEPGQRLGAGSVHAGKGGKIEANPLRRGDLNPSGHAVKHGHATDLFAGAQVFEQHTAKGAQRSYATFRTISTAQPEGWIHPGYKPGAGADLAREVDAYIDHVAPAMIAAAMDGSRGA